jgi:hypothetical protein
MSIAYTIQDGFLSHLAALSGFLSHSAALSGFLSHLVAYLV